MWTKPELAMLRQEIDQALEMVAIRHGLTMSIGNISYDNVKFTTKLEVKRRPANGKSAEQADFDQYCRVFDLTPNDYGRMFISNGKNFRLVGFNMKARSMPIIAEADNGSRYKFKTDILSKLV